VDVDECEKEVESCGWTYGTNIYLF